MAYFKAALVLNLLANPVCAKPLVRCNQLQAMLHDVRAGGIAPYDLAGAERCFISTSMNGTKTHHCVWSFPFRDVAAGEGFLATVSEIETCFPNISEPADDKPVNHPDSYDLRQYDVGENTLTISLKDKGALGRTYVFLGVGEQ